CSPNADNGPILHDPGQVVQEISRIPSPIDLPRFGVSQIETRTAEVAKMIYVMRIRLGEQFADRRANDLIRGLVTIHPRHRVVAFGEISVFENHLDLLVFGQFDRNWLFHFEAPDRFRTIRDEGAIAFFALPETS